MQSPEEAALVISIVRTPTGTHEVQCNTGVYDKKAQLSLTNPRDAKACQKLLQFDVLTTLSLTILAYLHLFSCEIPKKLKFKLIEFKVIQGHRSWCQWKAHMSFP